MVLAVLAALAVGATAAYQAAGGWTDPPRAQREMADAALRAAREAEAATWAPVVMANATAVYRDALVEERRQELRSFLTRDFRRARRDLADAAWSLRLAATAAGEARQDARSAAEGSIDALRDAVRAAEVFTEVMPLAPDQRARLRRAQRALAEATGLNRQGAFALAASRARAATADARRVADGAAAAAARYVDGDRLRTWERWIKETIAWSRRHRAPAIVVVKESHRLELYRSGELVRRFDADLGWNTVSDKHLSGDRATPEGKYRIVERKQGARTRYYKALLLDYPNTEDRRQFEEAKRKGMIPPGAQPGGLIEIHGDGGRGENWTDGCVALANDDMDRVFAAVLVGTPVTIVGSSGGGVFTDLVERNRDGGNARRAP
jgi:L,D-peptidoglycan transpeptidase YkuD (ErfK/YbiS/YcfS/YnhG family)